MFFCQFVFLWFGNAFTQFLMSNYFFSPFSNFIKYTDDQKSIQQYTNKIKLVIKVFSYVFITPNLSLFRLEMHLPNSSCPPRLFFHSPPMAFQVPLKPSFRVPFLGMKRFGKKFDHFNKDPPNHHLD